MNATTREGMKSFWEGSLDNPYPVNSKKHKDWEFGFNKAYFINLRKVKERETGTRSKGVRKEKVYA